MKKITFFKEFEGAVTPNRGNSRAAGIDFYVPMPHSVFDKCFDYCKNRILESLEDEESKLVYQKRCESIIEDPYLTIECKFWKFVIMYDKVLFGKTINIDDVYYNNLVLHPGQAVVIPCGISAIIEPGYALNFLNKSGIASKKNLHVGAQLIDEDYRGIMHINLQNVGTNDVYINCGQKIVQGVIIKTYIDEFELEIVEGHNEGKSERGSGGFGSTGV